jgi:hypothetical protein
MVGDRYLTDVVFGNRLGMLTVRPTPFTSAGEPKAVLLVCGEAAALAAARRLGPVAARLGPAGWVSVTGGAAAAAAAVVWAGQAGCW